MTTLQLPLETWEEKNRQITRLQEEIGELKAQRTRRILRLDEIMPVLVTALEESLELVAFGVANLDPLTVRGWPFQSLREFGALLTELPLDDERINALVPIWNQFAEKAEEWELHRAHGREQQVLREQNRAHALSPEGRRTLEAAQEAGLIGDIDVPDAQIWATDDEDDEDDEETY